MILQLIRRPVNRYRAYVAFSFRPQSLFPSSTPRAWSKLNSSWRNGITIPVSTMFPSLMESGGSEWECEKC